MKRSKISHNIYNWASSFKGLGIVVFVLGIVLCTVEPTIGPIILASGVALYISGVFAAPLGVLAEAANKYLEIQEKAEEKAESSIPPRM